MKNGLNGGQTIVISFIRPNHPYGSLGQTILVPDSIRNMPPRPNNYRRYGRRPNPGEERAFHSLSGTPTPNPIFFFLTALPPQIFSLQPPPHPILVVIAQTFPCPHPRDHRFIAHPHCRGRPPESPHPQQHRTAAYAYSSLLPF